ncbi:MAG: hypothetical protein IKW16_04655 [Clostridia bacterium]|nr:hypothetical protein [Clostridia bacterium]
MNLEFIDCHDKQLILFDMDGVVAEYVAGEEQFIVDETPGIYSRKRPLKSIIAIAEELNKRNNISVGILSSCEYYSQITEKQEWLRKYMPFLDESNIHIIAWCDGKYTRETRMFAKLDVIKTINGYEKIFLIEDKHDIIKATNKSMPGVAHHISELID